ncbi:MAG: class I SAM-dependent methyltransferase [bacterium]
MRAFIYLLIIMCASQTAEAEHLAVYKQALADPTRPADARARDVDRKPLEVLQLAGVAPGDRVLEIAPGAGYYTAILSRVLGNGGELIAVDPERLFKVFEQGRKGFPAYALTDPRQNVRYSTEHLDELELDSGLDQVWMILYYHDTLWTGENRAEMNARFFAALKPGGRYVVVDHHALPGAPASAGRELHRMDKSLAIREIQAAGFRLKHDSNALRFPDDPRDDSVFNEDRRGRTDRFALLFEKPLPLQ